jgi:hypothetical protein
MNWLQILEQYGIPLCVAIAFGFFIWKQNKFIQDELQKELRESFNRIESIIIKLIDQQKGMQIENRGYKSSFNALVNILSKLFKNKIKE